VAAVKALFADERFRPDMLKIYPTLVVGGTVLKQWMDAGQYSPYSTETASDVVSEFYRHIPKYVRVMRIQRDIPANRIEGGVDKSNLRELVEQKIREKGIIPAEIRYREVGLARKNKKSGLADFNLERLDYRSSGGDEVFLSFENKDGLIAGFLRLRFPSSSPRPEITGKDALIRELHVYGSEVPLEGSGQVQHKGLGSRLLLEAEEIARERGKEKMVIISGVGVREYYRRFGYALEGPYMSKMLG
jgi:elongator complex protein 3